MYLDASRPGLVDGFARKTFTAMIQGVRQAALSAGLIEPHRSDEGIEHLLRTTKDDGVLCYTFFKAVASNEGRGGPHRNTISLRDGRRMSARLGVGRRRWFPVLRSTMAACRPVSSWA